MHILGVNETRRGLELIGDAIGAVGDARGQTRAGQSDTQGDGTCAIALDGAFKWTVSGPRVCIGKWERQTDNVPVGWYHVPCPTGQIVGHDFVCLACSGFESPDCVFEPQCARDPAGCHCTAFRGVSHLVYLAFHGTLAKVGMTQTRRVANRLREQGADGWLVIQSHQPGDADKPLDRAAARAIERQVSFLYGIPEWRSHRETLPQMARPVPWEVVEDRASQMRERLATRYEVEREFHRITDHPVAQPLPGIPARAMPEGEHAGTWLGRKGNHLFYTRGGGPGRLDVGVQGVVALKASELLGRQLHLG